MKSDIEIANSISMEKINLIADKLDISDKYLYNYGNYIAKIDNDIMNDLDKKEDGKLILVTSTNPTPMGEGKTTMAIGLDDALCKLGYKSLVTLREPSLGPVFGIKGGAAGGGYAQVVPMQDINLHFTGDIHAITACNNLMCAGIDNHIMQGNTLNIDPNSILVKRCMDINDRALRQIEIGFGKNNGVERKDGFVITVATEIMAILCLSKDLMDLKQKLGRILVAKDKDGKYITVHDLSLEGAMTILLKDAIKPNLVQTLENNPAIIHGGPFANIAHGCNSLIATKMALKLASYVVTEAGFGSDLGALKFMDIKSRIGDLNPDVVIINTTLRSLKYNGLCPKEEVASKNIEYLEKGIDNLLVHIENMKKFTSNIIVCLNKFENDSEEEINYVNKFCTNLNVEFSISTAHRNGSEGSIDLAKKVVEMANNYCKLNYLYKLEDSIKDKIEIISKEIFHGAVEYSDEALKQIDQATKLGYDNLPICIAKTQYSITDDAKKLGYPKDNIVHVRSIKVQKGAGFIVIYMGNIMTMPGLSKTPSYMNMDIDEHGVITVLF